MNNCPNCGSSVNQGDAFCKVCGTKLPLPQNNISNNTQQFQGVSNQQQSIILKIFNKQVLILLYKNYKHLKIM